MVWTAAIGAVASAAAQSQQGKVKSRTEHKQSTDQVFFGSYNAVPTAESNVQNLALMGLVGLIAIMMLRK